MIKSLPKWEGLLSWEESCIPISFSDATANFSSLNVGQFKRVGFKMVILRTDLNLSGLAGLLQVMYGHEFDIHSVPQAGGGGGTN